MEKHTELADSGAFLALDVLFSAGVMYSGGRAIGRRAPKHELTFGIVLALVSFALVVTLFWISDIFVIYPMLYVVTALLTILVAVPYGAYRTVELPQAQGNA